MRNAILPDTLAVFAIGSTLVDYTVTTWDLLEVNGIDDTQKYIEKGWNVTKSSHQNHT